MSLSSSQLRKAWRAYEGAAAKMVDVNIGSDTVSVAPETVEAWQALDAVLDHHNYKVRKRDTATYADRVIAGTKVKSLHAYGIALDLNWQSNPVKYNPQHPVRYSGKSSQDARAADVEKGLADTDMTREMVSDILAIRSASGKRVFEWGGDWQSKIDTMHFEIDVAPSDLSDGVNWATVRGGTGTDPLPAARETEMSGSPAESAGAEPAAEIAMPEAVWTDAFIAAHEHVEKWEGGFVNHPDDPGGATNFGITRNVLSAWRGRPVSVDEVRTMSIAEARRIFYVRYWTPMRLDELPWPMAMMTYNCGVNSGPRRGGRFLQKVLNRQGAGLQEDGVIGSKTIGAASAADTAQVVRDYAMIYEAFYRGLHHWPVFGKGWMNRLNDITQVAGGGPVGESLIGASQPGAMIAAAAMSAAPAAAGDAATAIVSTNQPTEVPDMNSIDIALGGRHLVGKKTLIAGILFVAATILKQAGFLQIDDEAWQAIIATIATYGGLGAIAKLERSSGEG